MPCNPWKLGVAVALALLPASMAMADDKLGPDPLSAICNGGQSDQAICLSATVPTATTQAVQGWMSPDVGAAWAAGYKGKGVTITVVDDFSSSSRFSGNLGLGTQYQRHGEWTREEASMIAPLATIKSKDFSTNSAVTLAPGLNVLNLSYGMYAKAGYSVSQIRWSPEESSIISYATNGKAVVAKAAGNDSVAVGGITGGQQDYLDIALVGKASAIFVGALSTNGTTANPAQLAWYSNYAGSNPLVQSHFLVVGVDGSKTGLYGTSFAAPIIAGYAAIIGSKFTSATATQITNDLLKTARTDTLANYNPSIYGKGEASLSRALAPVSIK
ncbi:MULTISPECIES: S8 family serine peptidase [unclassified Mesorhizobium]|uniref:S8 family serine peptidase n=1 Tax=unclassified Mesorhizobium TaxID=325217 RepID=UPI000BAEC5AF|nr:MULTISPECIES: S8 family serine peptidase [unclassified Mesorhizobium]TGT57446.1 peptidase S8 and S53 subtilisin kexin sedolisin [Mesorhizobium sp. M00.F.Ca.ET.170.01.1.1]AZO11822.1 peptidase S8 and S53 subtilisin kexin sedolisin [Mesorhizobium sp. M3A.F.Ca.ET.080.04.2.1]PBB86283.1 peptidase S8 and S53 subtilisin kexin sedolisin [Mesorhizobium sp. WSM3876]RWB73102.1 MAG: peptidase S8 and S53 subtilisin kexin sedolisin [Mesorhizobium sp.]RWB82759.1 MAG: peptidase S8 and S53 subtilisin kexin s